MAEGNFAVDLGRNVVKYESQLRLDLTLVFTLIQLTLLLILPHTIPYTLPHTLLHTIPNTVSLVHPLMSRNWPGQAIGFWLPVSPP